MDLSQALIEGKGISLGEALSTGGMVTGLGLTIVFLVLLILMIILILFKVIFYKDPAKQTVSKKEAPAAESEPVIETAQSGLNEEELVAVLTAAVAASLNTSTYNLKIKSYRRINDSKPAWNKAGIRETINNRF